MSRVFQPKRKEFANAKVVSSGYYNNNSKRLKYVGSINRGFTNFVTTKRNRKTGKCSYIDDTSALTKKAKNEIVRFFADANNREKGVAYLVVDRLACGVNKSK